MNQYFSITDKGDFFKKIKPVANWIFLLGILYVLIGSLAIIYSFRSTLLSVVFLGALLVTAGIIEGIKAFKLSKLPSFLLHLFLGILYVISGVVIITNPIISALYLTLALASVFIVSGIFKISFAFSKELPHTGWLVLSGILNIIIGTIIWQQWPISGIWVLGTLIGIEMLFTGSTWIMLASAAKKATRK